MNRYAGKVLARCIELCPLFGSRFHVLFSGHARLSLGSSYVALVWPWLDFTFLGVQLRGLGVALVGFHIPWGPATWPWCGLGWISHSQ